MKPYLTNLSALGEVSTMHDGIDILRPKVFKRGCQESERIACPPVVLEFPGAEHRLPVPRCVEVRVSQNSKHKIRLALMFPPNRRSENSSAKKRTERRCAFKKLSTRDSQHMRSFIRRKI
jgi:hypothetical protein